MTFTTPTPNYIYDSHLKTLSESQLKVLLVIIRQTYGWYDTRTRRRKERDWITRSFFQKKTGLSNTSISQALSHLCDMKVITITLENRTPIPLAKARKGQKLYYQYNQSKRI